MLTSNEMKRFEKLALPCFYLAIAVSMLFTVVAFGTIFAVGLGVL